MRTIKLKLPTQNNLVTVKAQDVVTLGDLHDAIRNERINIDIQNSKLIARGNLAEYINNRDAILPQGDVILYVTPLHTKLGGDVTPQDFMEMNVAEGIEFLQTLNYNTIRTFGRQLGEHIGEDVINAHSTFSAMVSDLEDFIYMELEEETVEDTVEDYHSTVPGLIAQAIQNLEQALARYEETDFVDGVTRTALEEEHERLIQLNIYNQQQ